METILDQRFESKLEGYGEQGELEGDEGDSTPAKAYVYLPERVEMMPETASLAVIFGVDSTGTHTLPVITKYIILPENREYLDLIRNRKTNTARKRWAVNSILDFNLLWSCIRLKASSRPV